jgi:hypothetical protein
MRLVGYGNAILLVMYFSLWFIYREAGVAIAMPQLLTAKPSEPATTKALQDIRFR